MIISIARKPEGLFALQVTAEKAFDVPDKNASLDNGSQFKESFNPISAIDARDYSRLQKSIEKITTVENPSAEVLLAVLEILINTVANSSSFSNKPFTPFLSTDADAISRSAANPRGFKGTKYKPPKKKSPYKKNLLPHLDGGHKESSVLNSMSEYLDETIEICSPNMTHSLIIKKNGINNLRPFGQIFPAGMIDQIALLPKNFHKYFTWVLRGMNESQIGHMINCYWKFDLENNDQLGLIIAMMIKESPTENCIQWILSMEATSNSRRNCLAETLMQTGIFHMSFDDRHELISRLDNLCDDHEYRHRAYYLLKHIRSSRSAEYAIDGFRLANKYKSDYKFNEEIDGGSVYSTVEHVMPFIEDHSESSWVWNTAPMWIWKSCGVFKDYSALIKTLDLKNLGPDTVFSIICSLRHIHFLCENKDLLDNTWNCVKKKMPIFIDLLKKIPPNYHMKSLKFFDEAIHLWYDEGLDDALDYCFQITRCLCKNPFDKDDNVREPLFSFLRSPIHLWPKVNSVNDKTFLYLEKKCVRDNDARLIGLGLWSFAYCMPELAIKSFNNCISNFCRTMKELGCLKDTKCKQLLRKLEKTRLFQDNFLSLTNIELVQLIEHSFDTPSPYVSKRLRNHLAGKKTLSQEQEKRDIEKIKSAWSEILLAKINEYVLQELKKDLHPSICTNDSKSRHALMIQNSVEENRRALRKMIRAYLDGQDTYINDHPISKEWFADHPKINKSLWLNGIILPKTTNLYHLSLEQDPFEVLRMGTYVGSCLGLGGKFTFSAAAITLDINKQVIYCRDEKGSVLARQLLAISEEEELYCFDIYPDSTNDEIKKLFWQYDTLFASSLNLQLHDPDKEDDETKAYGVEYLLSQGWWDDHPIKINDK